MSNDFQGFQIKSKTYYKSIVGIDFRPLDEIELKKIASKGETRYWKLLGIIPIFRYEVEEDLYLLIDGLKTSKEVEKDYEDSEYEVFTNGKLFNKAKIIIRFDNGDKNTIYFSTNEDAIQFANGLKLKCKAVGNELS